MTLSVPKINMACKTNYYQYPNQRMDKKSLHSDKNNFVNNSNQNINYGSSVLGTVTKPFLYSAMLLTALTGCVGINELNRNQNTNENIAVVENDLPRYYELNQKRNALYKNANIYERLIKSLTKKYNESMKDINLVEEQSNSILSNYVSCEKTKKEISIDKKAASFGLTRDEYILINPYLEEKLDENGNIPKKTKINNPSIGLACDLVKKTIGNLRKELNKYAPNSQQYKDIYLKLQKSLTRYRELSNISEEIVSDTNINTKEKYSAYDIFDYKVYNIVQK